MTPPTIVAVIGGSRCSRQEAQAAERIGRGIAERGHMLLCGGRGGVMEAACRGARKAGGLTIGLLPGDDPRQANPYVAVPIPTGIGEARNVLVARGGRLVVAIGGSYGTLNEIAFALEAGRPVVGLWTWQASDHQGTPAGVEPATSAEQVLGWIDAQLDREEVE